ncbi:uncharacterized protein LOC106171844 [Lingula anatina]|uniref:Uncharacterized protein LOC106171844 n=1 Tax=Lingula anatina TaxID=7574 RepID=A0A1S3JC72_LINAN|nr:uncharacterized protein LOC106171844 [Lingula anatina]|eukprot:XP_013407786.2 uncharacterized protein LOC106171844 [Lingula anatina]
MTETADEDKNVAQVFCSSTRSYALRLTPGQEIRSALVQFVQRSGLKAVFVMTCVGSVRKATLRMATNKDVGKEEIKTFNENFEIVSLVGTLRGDSDHLHPHLHISLSDVTGHVIGGHVIGDLIVHTTAEIVLGECMELEFKDVMDPETGYNELVIEKRQNQE